MTDEVRHTLDRLKQTAAERAKRRYSGKTVVAVQVGHCSRAVGAEDVAMSLATALAGRADVELAIAGCDGACFNAPQVLVTPPGGDTLRFGRVTPEDAVGLVVDRGDPDSLQGFFAGQQRLVLGDCGATAPTDLDEYLAAADTGPWRPH